MKKKWKEYILPIIALILLAMATGSFAILHAMSNPVTNSFKGGVYQYELVLNANGGELSDNKLEQENTGESHEFDVSEKVPIRVGYDFMGWADSETATSPAYIDTVTVGCTPGVGSASKTVYAVWREKEPRLVNGTKFQLAITGCTEVVFGKQETYAAEVSGIEGDSIDAYGRDVYKLYKVGTTAYVLTNTPDGKIYANEDSRYMFNNMNHLKSIDFGDNFDTSKVNNMAHMFHNARSITSLDLSTFDTSNVRDMSCMFRFCNSLTRLDLSSFDTSKVNNMQQMFDYCHRMTDLDLSSFDTAKVNNMKNMFAMCGAFKELDLISFDTSNVTLMDSMFVSCRQLQTVYVGDNWSTEKVSRSGGMFKECGSIVGGSGTKYSSSKVDKEYARIDHPPGEPGYLTYGKTYECELTLNANGGEPAVKVIKAEHKGKGYTFDLSKIEEPTRLGYDFMGWAGMDTAAAPEYIDSVTVYYNPTDGKASKTVYAVWKEKEPQLAAGKQFKTAITGCTEVVFGDKQTYAAEVANIEGSSIDAYGRDVYMLYKVGTTAYVLTDTPDVKIYANEDSQYMFSDMADLRSIHFGDNFDTSRVTNMQGMFKSSTALTSLDVSKFDTSNVTSFCLMFAYLQLDKIDGVEDFVTAEATNLEDMFAYCSKITTLDLSNYETSKVRNMHGMFTGCTSLKTVDISKFDTRKVERIQAMFSGCRLLETIYVGLDWDLSGVPLVDGEYGGCTDIFKDCLAIVGEKGTTYDSTKIHNQYARIDDPDNGKPGYLTYKASGSGTQERDIPLPKKQAPIAIMPAKQQSEEYGEEIC